MGDKNATQMKLKMWGLDVRTLVLWVQVPASVADLEAVEP